MKKKIISLLITLVVTFTIACPAVFAADVAVTVSGTVYGTNNTVIPYANVSICSNTFPYTSLAQTTTDGYGRYTILTNLAENTQYYIMVSANVVNSSMYNLNVSNTNTNLTINLYAPITGIAPNYPNYPGYPNLPGFPGGGNIINGYYDQYGNYVFSYYDTSGVLRYGYIDKDGITHYDSYAVSNYTVAFDSMGGSTIESIGYRQGDLLVEPTAPTKSGYVFGGWYTEKEITNMLKPNTFVESNMTLYARWLTESVTPTPTPPVTPAPPANNVETEVPQTGDATPPILPLLGVIAVAGGFIVLRRRHENSK